MAGPWEKYGGAPAPDGPWAKYAQAAPAPEQPAPPRPSALAASNQGIVQGITLGFGDELMAGLFTPIEMAIRAARGEDWSPSAAYSGALERERKGLSAAQEAHPIATGVGTLAGGVMAGGGLANAGLSAGARAAQAGASLPRVAAGSAIDGGVVGAVTGFGSGEGGFGERAADAAGGGFIGAAGGAIAPFAVTAAQGAGRTLLAPVLARASPQSYADNAIGAALQRSGMTPQQVEAALLSAQADGQGVFTVADALGNPGQRMLSTVTRTPNDMRAPVIEELQRRQAGQGRRVSTAIGEAFDAPQTAQATRETMTQARDTAADAAYGAVRQNAGAVDVSGVIARIDDTLQPGITGLANPQTNIADDSIEGALRRVRNMLTDGRSNLTDWVTIHRARQDLADMVTAAQRAGLGNRARLLGQVRGELDTALENASTGYRAANNAFRQASQEIDAIDTGAQAAMRGRPEDTVANFAGLTPQQQQAFRVGYADRLMGDVENAPWGTNKVRPLISDATGQEFPAFAAPGRADQLGNRIAREQTMFETRNQAIGNSSTAQNLADMADMHQWDPGVFSALFRGDWKGATVQAVMRGINETRGMPPRVVEQVARGLMETRPDVARALLDQAQQGRQMSPNARAIVSILGTSLSAATGGRAF